MRKILLPLFVALVLAPWTASAPVEESWMGIYMNGAKIGYSHASTGKDALAGQLHDRTDARTFMDTSLLGTQLILDLRTTTWTKLGKPAKMAFRVESSGRVQTIDAKFVGNKIEVEVSNSGAKTHKTLDVPQGAMVVDDALTAVLTKGLSDKPQTFYVLDPLTLALVKNVVQRVGTEKTQIGGKTIEATRLDIVDVRAVTKVFLDSDNEVLKAEGPMGIEMLPMSREEALRPGTKTGTMNTDLAEASKVRPDKPIPQPWSVRSAKLRVVGRDLANVPTGGHQKVTKDGDAWLIETTPDLYEPDKASTIAKAKAAHPEWSKPSLHIPSSDPKFVQLSRKIVGSETNAAKAAIAIHDWVYAEMRPNAGIGVIRDAGEVLASKEGVCRDYAVLTAALLRAAGIPARLASGLVFQDDAFYYHAWAEAWVGDRWLGVDSTRSGRNLTALHVKLAHGQVEDAYTFTFLDKARIEIADLRQ